MKRKIIGIFVCMLFIISAISGISVKVTKNVLDKSITNSDEKQNQEEHKNTDILLTDMSYAKHSSSSYFSCKDVVEHPLSSGKLVTVVIIEPSDGITVYDRELHVRGYADTVYEEKINALEWSWGWDGGSYNDPKEPISPCDHLDFWINISGIYLGWNTVTVTIYSTSGYDTASVSVKYVDDVNPVVHITSPNDGDIFDEYNINVISESEDAGSGIMEVGLEWTWSDGSKTLTEEMDKPYSWVKMTYGVSLYSGENTFVATAKDLAGNEGASYSITVTKLPPPPEPYVISPSNDGQLYDPECDIVTATPNSLLRDDFGDYIYVSAVDLNDQAEIQSTTFEYSRNGHTWTTIGIDNYGGFEGEYFEGGENRKIGTEGWSYDWDVSDLAEGYYYIKATMTDVYERSVSTEKQIYYYPTPPIPSFITPQPYDSISGTFEFVVDCDYLSINIFDLGILMAPKNAPFKKKVGTEKQTNVGPNGDDGENRYCLPTAIKNCLDYFVNEEGDKQLLPELPWKSSDKNLDDVDKDGEANIAMARALAENLSTDKNSGVASLSLIKGETKKYETSPIVKEGIEKYLKGRGRGPNDEDGYEVTTFGTKWIKVGANDFRPIGTEITWEEYEKNLRICEDVIFSLHPINQFTGDWDDATISLGGHGLTARAGLSKYIPGDEKNPDTHIIALIDPSPNRPDAPKTPAQMYWKNKTLTVEGKKVTVPVLKDLMYRNVYYFINGMWVISPKNKKERLSGSESIYSNLGSDTNGADGWSVAFDTTTVPDGNYVISAKLIDDHGYIGENTIIVKIENTNNPPTVPEKPTGPKSGKVGTKYTYSSKATDPDSGDEIYYLFDWGDENFSYLGPYNSGETVEASHQWNESGNYEIKVIARDKIGTFSDEWSDPVSTRVPRSKTSNISFLKLLEKYPIIYKLFQRFLHF